MKIELRNGNTIDIKERLIGVEYMTSIDGAREYYYATFIAGANATRYSITKNCFSSIIKGVSGGKNKENSKTKD